VDYLRSLKVDIASRVRLVVATHWHDDHIAGLAAVLRAAESAKFVNSAAYVLKDLVRVVKLGSETARQSSATKEFKSILCVLEERRQRGEKRDAVGPIQAVANRKLLALASPGRSVPAEVFALSPADGVLNRGEAELRHALSTIEQRRRPSRQGPNQLCVVLWLKVGILDVLLGADLEHVSGTTEVGKRSSARGSDPEVELGFSRCHTTVRKTPIARHVGRICSQISQFPFSLRTPLRCFQGRRTSAGSAAGLHTFS
jgi:hypothetical protein